MRFDYHHGLIWLPVHVEYNGNKQLVENCILDTGSATTAIDIEQVSFDYHKPAKIKRLYGIGNGTEEVVSQFVGRMHLDEHVFENVEIEFGNFKSRIGINGFIGNDILSNFLIIID